LRDEPSEHYLRAFSALLVGQPFWDAITVLRPIFWLMTGTWAPLPLSRHGHQALRSAAAILLPVSPPHCKCAAAGRKIKVRRGTPRSGPRQGGRAGRVNYGLPLPCSGTPFRSRLATPLGSPLLSSAVLPTLPSWPFPARCLLPSPPLPHSCLACPSFF